MKSLSFLLFCAALLPGQAPKEPPAAPCVVFPGSGQRPDLNCATIEKAEPKPAVSEIDKLRAQKAFREAQLALQTALLKRQQTDAQIQANLAADPPYRALQDAVTAAMKAVEAVQAALAKTLHCEGAVDLGSAECAIHMPSESKPEAVKK